MDKDDKLYNLRLNISTEAKGITFLLENVIYKSDSELEANFLADIALEKSKKILKMSEKIGKILNH